MLKGQVTRFSVAAGKIQPTSADDASETSQNPVLGWLPELIAAASAPAKPRITTTKMVVLVGLVSRLWMEAISLKGTESCSP
jgi:hypothetical protein